MFLQLNVFDGNDSEMRLHAAKLSTTVSNRRCCIILISARTGPPLKQDPSVDTQRKVAAVLLDIIAAYVSCFLVSLGLD